MEKGLRIPKRDDKEGQKSSNSKKNIQLVAVVKEG